MFMFYFLFNLCRFLDLEIQRLLLFKKKLNILENKSLDFLKQFLCLFKKCSLNKS